MSHVKGKCANLLIAEYLTVSFIVAALYSEANRSGIVSLSKKKGNHVCSECGEFSKETLIAISGIYL